MSFIENYLQTVFVEGMLFSHQSIHMSVHPLYFGPWAGVSNKHCLLTLLIDISSFLKFYLDMESDLVYAYIFFHNKS